MKVWAFMTSHLRILIEDADGRRWTAPVQVVKPGSWNELVFPLDEFVRADAPAAKGSPDSRKLKWFIFRDVTAFHSAARGENTLMLDDLAVR